MTRYAPSEPAVNNRLSEEQINSWRNQGFCLVHDLLPEEQISALAADAAKIFPKPDSTDAAAFKNFGSEQRFVFPSRSQAANAITLAPELLRAVADLLGVSILDLRLTQSDVWPKYGRLETSTNDYDNDDQRIHCDYPNHMLVHPPAWHRPAAVEIIIYFCHREEAEGATAVVPREGESDPAYCGPIVQTPGVSGVPYINDKARAEAHLAEHAPEKAEFREHNLYAREVLADYRKGSVLFYRHDTWHRGTPLKQGARRIVQNLTYRRADAEWVNTLHPGWSWSMYHPSQFVEQLIATISCEQRTVLGIPPPGHDYWDQQTITAMEARYAAWGIDMSPYKSALIN